MLIAECTRHSTLQCTGLKSCLYLQGFDQTINLILDETHERVYSATQGVEQVITATTWHTCAWNTWHIFTPRNTLHTCTPWNSLLQVVLGLHIVRGDNICVVGEIDEDIDQRLDLHNIKVNHPHGLLGVALHHVESY